MLPRLMAAMVLVFCSSLLAHAQGRGKPAPPPSRYTYTLEVDEKSLPKGVTLREAKDPPRIFMANSSEAPLVIDERFQGKLLVGGTKLMGGKVYHYFPSGVPMEGKTHLKGWQAPFGDIPETILRLPRDPEKIAASREPGLGQELPDPEPFSIPATYDGKAQPITGKIHYQLNPAYDEHHK